MTTSTSMIEFSMSDITWYIGPSVDPGKDDRYLARFDVRLAVFDELVDVLITDEHGRVQPGAGLVQYSHHAEHAAEQHGVNIDKPKVDIEGGFTAHNGFAFPETATQLLFEPGGHDEIGILVEATTIEEGTEQHRPVRVTR